MKPLKLRLVRVSPCCRVIWFCLLQNEVPVELEDVDVFGQITNEQSNFVLEDKDHRRLPVLEDGEQRISGGVSCLRYLEGKYIKNHKLWPDDIQTKAKMHSVIEWAASELHSVIGYKLVYPQFFDGSRLPGGAEPTESVIDLATRKVVDELEAIEKKYFSQGAKYICGDKPTIADIYVATVLVQLDWLETVDMKLWPKLNRWLKEMRQIEHWDTVHAKHKEFVESLKNVPFEST